MTNEEKAAILDYEAMWKEKIAHIAAQGDDNGKDRADDLSVIAALLRECAAMMRERGKVQWVKVAGSATRQMALYRGWLLEVGKGDGKWNWSADSAKGFDGDEASTLQAAQAAAVAWVDEQEGRNV